MVTGIFAHVDAGKTTLCEGLLYTSGAIRKIGRVDKKDTFLDTDALERERGITIFSKMARLQVDDRKILLLDTPGHVDFSAETERTMQVLDYAVLVVSGASGVQSHTRTLWGLLKQYQVPTFLFVNKMDQPGTDADALLKEIQRELSPACFAFAGEELSAETLENISLLDESLMEEYLETESLKEEEIKELIRRRKIFPCYFGSALKMQGVEELLHGIARYSEEQNYGEELGARIYKIEKDEKGNRLTFLKLTGGSLKNRDLIGEEKITGIRLYSGEKFESVGEVTAGEVCALTGITALKAGQGIGIDTSNYSPVLEPVLNYTILLPEGMDAQEAMPKLLELEEELPELQIVWRKESREVSVRVMGQVQLEVLERLVRDRYGFSVGFGEGSIVYKETIANPVEGVGHFEPLRHYAEVHLLLEPLPEGSGLHFATNVSEEMLAKNWQRLVMTHLQERAHRGVLTGSRITDLRLTLIAGRAHLKHTEGGDFRQATYRAIRQGLMEAENVLLEPFYAFRLELPQDSVGRAMTDLEKLGAEFELEQSADGKNVLVGRGPVITLRNYQSEVTAYTRGEGRIYLNVSGYSPCHNTEEVLESIGYDPEADLRNPCGSVFCSGGSGVQVPWDEVKAQMHVESAFARFYPEEGIEEAEEEDSYSYLPERARSKMSEWISVEEVDAILAGSGGLNAGAGSKRGSRKGIRVRKKGRSSTYAGSNPYASSNLSSATSSGTDSPAKGSRVRDFNKKKYLLVDGYNVIFAWKDLNELSKVTIDGARDKLKDILCNYQATTGYEVIVVFDAYRVAGHATEFSDYMNIHVVFTKEAETADQYIERFAHDHASKHDITVVTSDGLEQIIIRGEGCLLISSREFEDLVETEAKKVREILSTQKN